MFNKMNTMTRYADVEEKSRISVTWQNNYSCFCRRGYCNNDVWFQFKFHRPPIIDRTYIDTESNASVPSPWVSSPSHLDCWHRRRHCTPRQLSSPTSAAPLPISAPVQKAPSRPFCWHPCRHHKQSRGRHRTAGVRRTNRAVRPESSWIRARKCRPVYWNRRRPNMEGPSLQKTVLSHGWVIKQGYHHNGDQAAWRPHMMCSNLWSPCPWVPISSPLAHMVYLLPLLSFSTDSKSVSVRPTRIRWQIPL